MTVEKSALVVIDLQHDVIANAYDKDGVVERVAQLVDRARTAGAPVIWVQHIDAELIRGSEAWQLDDRLRPLDSEPCLDKTYSDSFSNPELAALLESLGVRRLVIVGAQSDFCIRNTWHSALVRGYDTVLVKDGHTTEDLEFEGTVLPAAHTIAYTNMYAEWGSRYPDAHGTAAFAAEIEFA